MKGRVQLVLLLLFYLYDTSGAQTKCRYNYQVVKECKNNVQTARITNRVLARGGRFRCETKTVKHGCGARNFCKCAIYGDPHYKTFDGVSLRSMRECRYVLAQSRVGRCAFRVIGQNIRHAVRRASTHLELVDFIINRLEFRLHRQNRVFLRSKGRWQIVQLPYKIQGVRVYLVGNRVRLTQEQCSLQSSWDGKALFTLSLSRRRYAGQVNGLCGNCDGYPRNDYTTSRGDDVRIARDRNSAVLNSWLVKPVTAKCFATEKGVRRKRCTGKVARLIASTKYCGIIGSGAFAKCAADKRVNAKSIFRSCVDDLCEVAGNAHAMRKSLCEILEELENTCASHGYTNLRWRSNGLCQMKCGKNKHFTYKLKRCPRTCASHFYGRKRLCHKAAITSGCQCNRGFVLDGDLCVKPIHCQCLEQCVDRLSTEDCKRWKLEGRCQRFPRYMAANCNKTCGNCQAPKKCEDSIRTKRCIIFKRKGYCKHEFYRRICGLTCQIEKCPCEKPVTRKGRCHDKYKIRTVYVRKQYRDSRNKCRTVEKNYIEICGSCPVVNQTLRSKCDMCRGSRKVRYVSQRRINKRCIRKDRTETLSCKRCKNSSHRTLNCRNDYWLEVIKSRTRIGCYKCQDRIKTRRVGIPCKGPRVVVKGCNRKTCAEKYAIVRYRLRKCKCEKPETIRFRKCCCPRNKSRTYCKTGRQCTVTLTYQLVNGKCKKTRGIKCKPFKCPDVVHDRGTCNKKLCINLQKITRYVLGPFCKCKGFSTVRYVRCCCPKPRVDKKCDKVTNTWVTVHKRWRLDLKRNKCIYTGYTRRQKVSCGDGKMFATSVSQCNRTTCIQVRKIAKKTCVNCKCKVLYRTERRRCCCVGRDRKFVQCRGKAWYYFHLIRRRFRGRCRWLIKSQKIRRIPCRTEPLIRRGDCKSGRDYDILYLFYIRRCRCMYRRMIRRLNCKCAVTKGRTLTGECDRRTCTQRYLIIKAKQGKRGCKFYKIKGSQRCCCTQKPTNSVTCNKRTGIELVKTTRYQFVTKDRVCVKRVDKKYIARKCNSKDKRTTRGKCGSFRRYFYLEHTVYRKLDRATCRCRTIRKTRPIRCRCGDPGKTYQECDFNAGVFILYKPYYRIIEQRYCEKKWRGRSVTVTCRPNRRSYNTKCIKGRFYFVKEHTRRVGCQCKVIRKRFNRLCGCKPKNVYTKCFGNYKIRYHVTYKLNKRKTQCRKHVRRYKITLSCKRSVRVIDKKCTKCGFRRFTVYFAVSRCKCRAVRHIVQNLRCCCPKAKAARTCYRNDRFAKLVLSYRLKRFQCRPKRTRHVFSIRCRRSKLVFGKCNKRTGKRLVKRQYYIIRKCKCLKRTRPFTTYDCKCDKKITIQRGDCLANGRRTVSAYIQKLIGHTCKKELLVQLVEDCRCEEGGTKHKCVKNKTKVRAVTTYILKRGLVAKHGIRLYRCERNVDVRRKDIECRPARVKSSKKCIDNKVCFRRIYYTPVNCKCVRKLSKPWCEPCDCQKLNHTDKKCVGRGYIITRYTYRAKGKKCVSRSKPRMKLVSCSRRRSKRGSCDIFRHNTFYRKVTRYLIRVRDCKCRYRPKTRKQFCRCRKPHNSSKCDAKTNNVITYRHRYRRFQGACRVITNVVGSKPTRCKADKIISRAKKCTKSSGYARKYVVRHYYAQNCKCRRRHATYYIKCRPKEAEIKWKCVSNSIKKFTVTTYRLVRGRKLFFAGKTYYQRVNRGRPSRQTKYVNCKPKTRVNNPKCIPGKKLKVTVSKVVPVKCKCKRQIVSRSYKVCPCLKPKVIKRGKCIGYDRQISVKFFRKQGNRCIPRTRIFKSKCRCRIYKPTYKCNGKGTLIRTHRKGTLRSRVKSFGKIYYCKYYSNIKEKDIVCRENYVAIGKCSRRTKLQTDVSYTIKNDKKACKCRKRGKRRTFRCICKAPYNSKKRCVNDKYYVYTAYNEVKRKDGSCKKISKPRRDYVRCPSNYRQKNRCLSNGYRIVRLFFYFHSKCECKKRSRPYREICDCSKIRKYRSVIDGVTCSKRSGFRKRVTTYYELINGQCVKKRRIKYIPIICSNKTRVVLSPAPGGVCRQIQRTFTFKAVNCSCKWVVTSRRTLNTCCKKEITISRRCQGRRWVYKLRDTALRGNRCKTSRVYTKTRVTVCRGVMYTNNCARMRRVGRCNGMRFKRKKFPFKCGCMYRIVGATRRKCCCSKKVKRKNICEYGVVGTSTTRQKYEYGFCVPRTTYNRIPLNCEQKECKLQTQPCRNNFRPYRLRCYKTSGCRCKLYTKKSGKQRCGCNVRQRNKDGQCNSKTCRFTRSVQRLEFVKATRKCVWRTKRRFDVVCCCKKGQVRTPRCLNGLKSLIRIEWEKFNKENNSCVTKKKFTTQVVRGCSRRARYTGSVTPAGKCNKSTGYQRVKRWYVIARRCRCIKRFRSAKRICCCSCIKPDKTEHKCIGTVRHTYNYSAVKKGGKCVYEKTKVKENILCSKTLRYRGGKCRGTRKWSTPLLVLKQVVRKCQCVWRRIKRTKKLCRCPETKVKYRCLGSRTLVRTTTTFRLVGNKCEVKHTPKRITVPCKVGVSYKITKRCRKNGKFYLRRRVLTYLRNCKCKEKRSPPRTCHCRCRKNSYSHVCKNFVIHVTELSYKKKNCRCRGETRNYTKPTPCPRIRRRVIRGKCIGRDIGYRKNRIAYLQKDRRNCKCRIRYRTQTTVCRCKRKTRTVNRCKANRTQVKYKLVRRLHQGKCKFLQRNYREIPTKCERGKTIRKCNKKSGIQTNTQVYYIIRKCECIRKTRITTTRCKCSTKQTFLSKSKCNRKTCFNFWHYSRLVLKAGKCVPEKYKLKKRCCCPLPSTTTYCDKEEDELVRKTVFYMFEVQRCIRRTKYKRDPIDCSRKPVVKNKCNKRTGVLVSRHFRYVRVNCKCTWKQVRKFVGRCRCKKPFTQTKCERSRRRIGVVTISYKLEQGQCYKQRAVVYKGIRCVAPAQRVVCNDKSGVELVTRFIARIDRKCNCIVKPITKKRRCRCAPREKIRSYCKNSVKYVVYRVTKLTPSRRCRRFQVTEKYPTVCKRKVIRNSTKCRRRNKNDLKGTRRHTVIRYYKSGCKCKRIVKHRTCDCDCRRRKNTRVCMGRYWKITRHVLFRERCKCKTRSAVRTDSVICGEPYTKVTGCNERTGRIATYHYSFIIRNCKCVVKSRATYRRCKCRKPETKKTCVNQSNTLIHKTTHWQLRNGKCIKFYTRRNVPFFCGKKSITRAISRCNTRTRLQRWERIVHVAKNCRCSQKIENYVRVCKCKRPFTTIDECSARTCFQAVKRYAYVLRENGCFKFLSRQYNRRCCCHKKFTQKYSCRAGRRFSTHAYYRFNRLTRTCKLVVKSREVRPNCRIGRAIETGKCDEKTGIVRVAYVMRRYVNCRCIKSERVTFGRCKCPATQRRHRCVSNGIRQTMERQFMLRNFRCLVRYRIGSFPVRCNYRAIKVSRCNRLSCYQNYAILRAFARNCKCVLLQRRGRRTCCCDRRVKVRFNYCDAKRGRVYFIKESRVYDRRKKRCIDRKISFHKTARCRRRPFLIRVGACSVVRGKYRYRVHYYKYYIRLACKCVRRYRKLLALCDCGKPIFKSLCDAARGIKSIVKYYQVVRVAKNGRRFCARQSKLVRQGIVRCELRNRYRESGCVLSCCKKNVHMLVYKRFGCICSARQIKREVTCCCKKPSKKTLCANNKFLKTTYTINKLRCRNRYDCRCVPTKTHVPLRVNCEKPSIKYKNNCSLPKKPHILIQATYNIVKNCKCVQRTVNKKYGCKTCTDFSSDCKRLALLKYCERDRHIQQNLCRASCGLCRKCKTPERFRIVRHRSIQGDKVAGGKYVIYKRRLRSRRTLISVMRRCVSYCRTEPRCLTAELRRPRARLSVYNCYLFWAWPKDISNKVQPLGDFIKRPGSFVFVKYCRQKCKKWKMLSLTKCICIRFINKKLCYKYASIRVYVNAFYGNCYRKVIRRRVTCNPLCNDRLKTSQCLRAIENHTCKVKEIQMMCAESCKLCNCNGKFVLRGRCRGGRQRFLIVNRFRWRGICMQSFRRIHRACKDTCNERKYRIPGPCIKGKRVVTVVTVKRKGYRCEKDVKRTIKSCATCCPTVVIKPGRCKGGRRVITKIWWDNVNGCCKEEIARRTLSCFNCLGSIKVRNGPCQYNYRVTYKTYYVRSGKRCRKRLITKLVRCTSKDRK